MAELSESEIKRQLQQMDPYEFEELTAEVWELQGYQTTVRKSSGDRGIDIEAKKESPFSEKVLIQAKRYSGKNKVGSDEVRKYRTLYQQVPDADTVVIVTSGAVTSDAQRLAQDLNVKIVDGDSFAEMVADNRHKVSIDLRNKSSSQNRQQKTNSSSQIRQYNTNPIPFNKCPNCNSNNIRMEYGMAFKCLQCYSKWEEDSTGKPVKWRGVSGEVEGKLGTTDEWKHHSNDIEFHDEEAPSESKSMESESEENKNISNDITIFERLAAIPIIALTFSSIHSLLSWSIHSYQLWLVIIIVVLIFTSAVNKL